MAAQIVMNVRFVDGGKIPCICSRKLHTISKTRFTRKPCRHVLAMRKKSSGKEKLTSSGTTEICDKMIQEQSLQWHRLRDTMSGIRATVNSLSAAWQSNHIKNKAINSVAYPEKLSEQTTDCDQSLKLETSIDKSEVHKLDCTSNDRRKIKQKSEAEERVSEEWITQILGIHDEKNEDPPKVGSDKILNKNNTQQETVSQNRTAERLDDPFAQVDTKLIPQKQVKSTPASSYFSNRINFSYFSKSKNTTKSLKESLEKKKSKLDSSAKNKTDNEGSSTSGDLRDNEESNKKNTSNSAASQTNGENTDADKTVDKKAVSKNDQVLKTATQSQSPTNADWSYWNMLSNIQQSIMFNLPLSASAKTASESQVQAAQIATNLLHSEFESESGLITRTRSLSENLINAESVMSKLKRVDELCAHLTKHPQFRHVALKQNVLPRLLQMRDSDHPKMKARANEALSLIGYHSPPQGRGIRMLSIDGGGTRGLIAIEMMQRIEQLCNRPISEMFDFVIGSSTGALMAALVFIFKIPLPECKELYLDRSARMFVKESLLTKTKNMAIHDVKIFEEILQAEMGHNSLISTARNQTIPKFAVTSTLANVPKWKTYLFRNYNHSSGVISDYEGSCNLKVWEAVRASGSAPVYYSPFQIGEHIFRDGGCLANNPTAVGLHECKLLWPHESFQCVLSLGNGKFDPNLAKEVKKKEGYSVIPRAMKDLADGFIDSATDTEGVHLILKNTLDPASYFRLSPYLQENYELSEVKPDKVKQMIHEAKLYIERNDILIQKVAVKLKQDRLPNQKLVDFTSQRKITHDYLLF